MSESVRRLARVEFTPDLLAAMCSGRFEVASNPVPPDAKVVRCYYDVHRDVFGITLESREFSPVKDGDVIPFANIPMIRRLDRDGDTRPTS